MTSSSLSPVARKQITIWLLTMVFFTGLIVMIGGITRLTRSGLSITEWKPIMGSLPPLNTQQWQESFDKYRMTPEYRLINKGMSLEDYKFIFFWEYLHRLLARMIGIIFLIPFIIFLLQKKIPRQLAWQTSILFFVGLLQGFMGWYMVKSGLVDNPSVSHYRLAIHLFLAFFVGAYALTLAIKINRDRLQKFIPLDTYRKTIQDLFFMVILQSLYGAFVAGLKAGKLYNTWPLMGDFLAPPGMFDSGIFHDLFENPITVQFIHRSIGLLILLFVIHILIKVIRNRAQSQVATRAMLLACALIILQFILGVTTLLLGVTVSSGVIHQVTAYILILYLTALLVLSNQKAYTESRENP